MPICRAHFHGSSTQSTSCSVVTELFLLQKSATTWSKSCSGLNGKSWLWFASSLTVGCIAVNWLSPWWTWSCAIWWQRMSRKPFKWWLSSPSSSSLLMERLRKWLVLIDSLDTRPQCGIRLKMELVNSVTGPPTLSQKTNAGVVNLLHQFDGNLRRSLVASTNLPDEDKTAIIDTLKCVATQMRNSLQPLLSSVTDAVEAILLTMHEEDFAA